MVASGPGIQKLYCGEDKRIECEACNSVRLYDKAHLIGGLLIGGSRGCADLCVGEQKEYYLLKHCKINFAILLSFSDVADPLDPPPFSYKLSIRIKIRRHYPENPFLTTQLTQKLISTWNKILLRWCSFKLWSFYMKFIRVHFITGCSRMCFIISFLLMLNLADVQNNVVTSSFCHLVPARKDFRISVSTFLTVRFDVLIN